MLVLAVGLLVVLLFGVAAVSVGHGNALSDTTPDRREPALPGRRIAAQDVEALQFTMALRGYRMDQVDAVLDRLAAELAVREAELIRLRSDGAVSGGAEPPTGTEALYDAAPTTSPGYDSVPLVAPAYDVAPHAHPAPDAAMSPAPTAYQPPGDTGVPLSPAEQRLAALRESFPPAPPA